MFNSPDDLIKSMREQRACHWELYRTYNNNNPSPIATSDYLGKDDTIDPEKSLRVLSDHFNVLGPGQYFVKYNTKHYFNKGYMSADVVNRQSAASTASNVSGIGAIPQGYITADVLELRLQMQQKEFENRQLNDKIGALEKGEGAKSAIQQVIEYVNQNQHISKGIGDLISSFANKINPRPIIHQPSTIGTTGFNKGEANTGAETEQQEPEHVKSLTDEQYEKVQSEMLSTVIALWYLDPDFPTVLPKLYQLAKENPSKYNMAKTLL
jgi:hypothetical protein